MKKLTKIKLFKSFFNNNLKIHKIEKRNENKYFTAFSRSNSVLFSNRNFNYNNLSNFSTNFLSSKNSSVENFFIKGKDRQDFKIEENKNEQKNKIKNILKKLNKWDANEKNNVLLNNDNFKLNKLKLINEQLFKNKKNLKILNLKENKNYEKFIFNYNLNYNLIYNNLLNDKLIKVINEKSNNNQTKKNRKIKHN